MNFLVVDDERDLLEITTENIRLEFDECHLYTAENGEQAIGLEANIDFDAIITDYKMPIKNGIELVKHVRKAGRNNNVPIIFISSYIPELNSFEKVWENVFFLEKPDGMNKITTFLRRLRRKAS